VSEDFGGADAPSVEVEEIRRSLERAVARLCPRWLHGEREDLVQNSMVRILERTRNGGSSDFNATYLWKTAHTVVLDEVRRVRWKYERALTDDTADPRTPEAEDPQSRALGRELVRAVRDCLLGLSDDRRRAVQLRLAGMRYAEVARSLDFDEKRAANLVFRGFEDLRACLRGKGAV
jgi:RNA polymerase sigma-70 factor (ECF subfamily)